MMRQLRCRPGAVQTFKMLGKEAKAGRGSDGRAGTRKRRTCLMGDEKSREEMTAVGGRSCGREAGCRETVGWSHAIGGGLRAAAKLTEGCVMWPEKGSLRDRRSRGFQLG